MMQDYPFRSVKVSVSVLAFLQYAHCNKLSDGFRRTSHLLVKEWTEYIFVDVTSDIAVKLHVPLLLVFVLLAFTLAHQG